MKRTRIAVIVPGGVGSGDFSQGYPPMVNFFNHLSAGFDVIVYSAHPTDKGFFSASFEVKAPPRFIKSSKLRLLYLAILFCCQQLWKRCHLVHGFWIYPAGTLAVVLGKIFRIPSIVTIQGGEAAAIPEIRYGNMLTPKIKSITLWTCEKATCLNSISNFLVSQMKRHGLKRNDAVIIPFGSQKVSLPGHPSDRHLLKILHVANLTEVKDQRTLIKSFSLILKKIPAQLVVIGTDHMQGAIQRYAEELKIAGAVDFKRSMSHNQLLPHYFSSHMMIHCSLHEGQSGVVTDAMARGVVVCGTPVGIISDLGEKYFQIAPIGDADKLASLALEIWDDPIRFHEMRNAAFEWAQEHDDYWTVNQYSKLYLSLKKVSTTY